MLQVSMDGLVFQGELGKGPISLVAVPRQCLHVAVDGAIRLCSPLMGAILVLQ